MLPVSRFAQIRSPFLASFAFRKRLWHHVLDLHGSQIGCFLVAMIKLDRVQSSTALAMFASVQLEFNGRTNECLVVGPAAMKQIGRQLADMPEGIPGLPRQLLACFPTPVALELVPTSATRASRSRIEPMQKIAKMLRKLEQLLLNWFESKGLSSGVVELGNLPEPKRTHRFCG